MDASTDSSHKSGQHGTSLNRGIQLPNKSNISESNILSNGNVINSSQPTLHSLDPSRPTIQKQHLLSQEENLEGGSTPPRDSLRQYNQELQGILDSFGEQKTEAYPLGNMFHKEFKEPCREATLVYALESLKKYQLRILKPQDSTHLTVTLKAVQIKKSLTN
ncbi:hypothetical protein FXO37_19164 [Capsicum annuum]|nr:hypothetical protein FXO37_19164 [Capsicum annuum]